MGTTLSAKVTFRHGGQLAWAPINVSTYEYVVKGDVTWSLSRKKFFHPWPHVGSPLWLPLPYVLYFRSTATGGSIASEHWQIYDASVA